MPIVSSIDTNGTPRTRPAPGHPGPAHSAHAADRGAARLGDLRAHPAHLRRRSPGEPGLAVPRTAPPRASGLDRGGVGGLRTRTPREVLPPHRVWPPSAGGRSACLGADVDGHRPGDEAGVTT